MVVAHIRRYCAAPEIFFSARASDAQPRRLPCSEPDFSRGPCARWVCGFFVAGNDAKLTNNASQVVLMRKGNRTVMAMSNNYQGPPDGFAIRGGV